MTMRTFVPHRAGDGVSAAWGVRRAVRLAFPGHAALADDAVHTERLRVYLTDLLRPYGLGLDPDAAALGGQSYGEMGEALIRLAVPAGESVDLLVLAYSVPDITPGRATTTYLSHVCPGGPMAFAVSDQGAGGAFTALRLIRAYAEAGESRRALLLVVEQPSLPYDPGVPVAVPAGAYGVALLFGEPGPGERPVRLGPVTTHTRSDPAALATALGTLDGTPEPVTAVVGASLAEQATALPGVERVVTADAGRPGTGVWWELAGELTEEPADPSAAPGRLVLAEHDAGPRQLSLAAFDIGAGVLSDAVAAATAGRP
ncbi:MULTISPECIES: hypothetical protein [unclassified Streptomyces]|uniref:hypothetical protein n=1 Tax=unclassified Streptomyces TaxID=2593676 RepID=UPI002E2C0D44|nr:hypothetical protein [Streptomyces sp. NBC_00223]